MKKILFVTSRNILSTCGELRLIKNRALALKNEYGYTTDYITYRLRKKVQNEDVGGEVTVLRAPLDRAKLNRIIKASILSKEYSCIVLSGNTINLARYIKKVDGNIKVIFDIHGTIEEYVEFRTGTLIERLLFGHLYRHTKKLEKKVFPFADGILAVSHPLAEHYEKLANNPNVKTFVVPCSIAESITQDKYGENRRVYREKYNLSCEDKVFVYSGGASPWQCVQESVELFLKVRDIVGDSCKMLLLSGNKELLAKYNNFTSIITDAVKPDEVMATLCAGDFGIMLRGNYETNNYAFPNKFLEYVGSGLRVIATPYVYDVMYYIKKFNLGCIIKSSAEGAEEVARAVLNEYDLNAHFKRRDELIKQCSFKETLRAFDEFLGGKYE